MDDACSLINSKTIRIETLLVERKNEMDYFCSLINSKTIRIETEYLNKNGHTNSMFIDKFQNNKD